MSIAVHENLIEAGSSLLLPVGSFMSLVLHHENGKYERTTSNAHATEGKKLNLRSWQVADVDQLAETVEVSLGCAPNYKYLYNKETDVYENRPHQYNCTYYSAIGKAFPRHQDRAYLMARAIQFFTPGIPMVYYVGLFAGSNDFQVCSP